MPCAQCGSGGPGLFWSSESFTVPSTRCVSLGVLHCYTLCTRCAPCVYAATTAELARWRISVRVLTEFAERRSTPGYSDAKRWAFWIGENCARFDQTPSSRRWASIAASGMINSAHYPTVSSRLTQATVKRFSIDFSSREFHLNEILSRSLSLTKNRDPVLFWGCPMEYIEWVDQSNLCCEF